MTDEQRDRCALIVLGMGVGIVLGLLIGAMVGRPAWGAPAPFPRKPMAPKARTLTQADIIASRVMRWNEGEWRVVFDGNGNYRAENAGGTVFVGSWLLTLDGKIRIEEGLLGSTDPTFTYFLTVVPPFDPAAFGGTTNLDYVWQLRR